MAEGITCSSGYSLGSNGGCYYFGSTKMSWYDAREYCASLGNGWLVTVNDQQEQDYLYSITGPSGPWTSEVSSNPTLYDKAYWIGLNDIVTYKKYVWVHSSSSYSNWSPGQPNHCTWCNPLGEADHCTQLNFVENKWADLPCSYAVANPICENDRRMLVMMRDNSTLLSCCSYPYK